MEGGKKGRTGGGREKEERKEEKRKGGREQVDGSGNTGSSMTWTTEVGLLATVLCIL